MNNTSATLSEDFVWISTQTGYIQIPRITILTYDWKILEETPDKYRILGYLGYDQEEINRIVKLNRWIK